MTMATRDDALIVPHIDDESGVGAPVASALDQRKKDSEKVLGPLAHPRRREASAWPDCTDRRLFTNRETGRKPLPISAHIAAGLRRDYSAVRRPICSIRASIASFC